MWLFIIPILIILWLTACWHGFNKILDCDEIDSTGWTTVGNLALGSIIIGIYFAIDANGLIPVLEVTGGILTIPTIYGCYKLVSWVRSLQPITPKFNDAKPLLISEPALVNPVRRSVYEIFEDYN